MKYLSEIMRTRKQVTDTMPYHGNTKQKAETESMPQFKTYFDSEDGVGVTTVRALNKLAAEKIVEDQGRNVVVSTIEKVAE